MTDGAKVLVVGRSGQIATALQETRWPDGIVIEARGRDALDLCRPDAAAAVAAEGGWAAVVNAAAYTDVDRAESEPDMAFALNRDGPAALAAGCSQAGIPLVHLSTDYVFDGTKAEPYTEDDPVNPISVYGASKAAGEDAVRTQLAQHVILRTSWVFSPTGRNFVRTMLRVGAERKELRIVDDQHGCPSAAQDIANSIARIVMGVMDGKADGFGTFHFAGTGATTWYGFAREIFKQGELRALASIPNLTPIPTSEYPTPAQRPMNSVLDTAHIAKVYGIVARPWQKALSDTLDRLLGPVERHGREGAAR